MVVLAMYLFVGGGNRNPAFYILTGGLLLLVANDSVYGLRNLHGNHFTSGSITEVGWLLYYLTAGASALHPSMRDLANRLPAAARKHPLGRILTLGSATLVGPVLLVVEALRGRPVDAFAIGIATFAIAALAAVRLSDRVPPGAFRGPLPHSRR
jgi:two-component system cell cycle response regulator